MTTEKDHRRAVLLLLLAALLWSSAGLVIKTVAFSTEATIGLRSCAAAFFLLLFIRRRNLTWHLPQVVGAMAGAASIILFVNATRQTTAANAILLQYTSPLYIAILGAALLHERVTAGHMLTMAVMGAGMVLFFFSKLTPGQFTGNLLAMISAVCIAVLAICMRMQAQGSPIETVFLANLIAATFSFPHIVQARAPALHWIIISAAGMFQLALPFVLYSWAIKRMKVLDANLVLSIEPILNPIWVLLLIGERPDLWAVSGGALVLGAILFRYTR